MNEFGCNEIRDNLFGLLSLAFAMCGIIICGAPGSFVCGLFAMLGAALSFAEYEPNRIVPVFGFLIGFLEVVSSASLIF